ncbi:MAG: hypothetical protein KAT27_00185, partial [Desulfobacterales bacterium]|nr:hypothetical protein [Desulfobacterales bacterium]
MNPQSINLALILNNLGTTGHETKHPNEGGFSGLLAQALEPGRGLRLQGSKKGTKTEGAGLSWLERFRNRVMSSGTPLKEMSLSREALPDL